MKHWYVIANPRSGAGGNGAGQRLARALRASGVSHEITSCASGADARALAQAACTSGHTHIAIAGGDGTAHHVVNGILAAGRGTSVSLALLPLGSGNDWARTLGIPSRLARACALLQDGVEIAHDAGELTLTGTGQRVTHFFVNAAGAGFDAHVIRVAQGRFGGRLRYLAGLLLALRSFSTPALLLRAPGFEYSEPTLTAILSNGRYLGGGMRIAPGARIDDGLLELTVVKRLGPAGILVNLPRLLLGTLAASPHVRSARVTALSLEGDTCIEADGELLGRAPAEFRVLPAALRVVVPPPQA